MSRTRGQQQRRVAGLVVVLSIAASSCGEDDATPAATTDMPASIAVPVVVDTDVAMDDLVALTFLLASDDVDVRAITVSGTGEVRCPTGVGVVQGLLERTGDEGVPVACGRSTPLDGAHQFPTEWRDAADSGWGVLAPASTNESDAASAVELLVDTIEPGVSLLTLGPLTNIADALRADAELATRVASIVIMGGALDVPGNVSPELDAAHSEWNLYVDPTAAAEVFGAGAPLVLVPLDATDQVPITPMFLERLALNNHTPSASLVADLYQANPVVGTDSGYFWDPLAAAALLDQSLLTTERADIAVVTGDGPDIGRTIRTADGHPIDVAISADARAFEDLLLRTLDGVAPADALVEPAADPPPDDEPSPSVGGAVVTYEGAVCSYDGPTTVEAGRIGFTFETDDSTWVAAVVQLTGESSFDDVVAWIEANPEAQEAPPGVGDVILVPAGSTTYVSVEGPGVGVVCSPYGPGPLLVAASLTVD
jgi:inosine-uridine nucleoside N-ribohydrolase